MAYHTSAPVGAQISVSLDNLTILCKDRLAMSLTIC